LGAKVLDLEEAALEGLEGGEIAFAVDAQGGREKGRALPSPAEGVEFVGDMGVGGDGALEADPESGTALEEA